MGAVPINNWNWNQSPNLHLNKELNNLIVGRGVGVDFNSTKKGAKNTMIRLMHVPKVLESTDPSETRDDEMMGNPAVNRPTISLTIYSSGFTIKYEGCCLV